MDAGLFFKCPTGLSLSESITSDEKSSLTYVDRLFKQEHKQIELK